MEQTLQADEISMRLDETILAIIMGIPIVYFPIIIPLRLPITMMDILVDVFMLEI